MAENIKEKSEKSEELINKEKRDKMVEVQTGKRVFDSEKYGLLQIRYPKVEENRLADWQYSKVFQQAIVDDIPTNREMDYMIKKRNLWTDADEEKIEKIKDEIQKQIVLLSKMETEKNSFPVKMEIDRLRSELFGIQQEKQRYYNNTAEAKAEEAKLSYLIYACTEKADTNKRLWKKYEDFQNEEDQNIVNEITYQFMTFINGLPADFLDSPTVDEDESEEEGSDEE